MTPDTRTTENPATPAIRFLRKRIEDGLPLYQGDVDSALAEARLPLLQEIGQLRKLLAIEAEAAQGAAPRAEGLTDDAERLAQFLKERYGDAAFGPAVGNLSIERFRLDADAILATIEGAAPRAEGLDVDDLAAFFHEEYWEAGGEPHLSREQADSTDCEICWRSADRLVVRLSPQERRD